MTVRVDPDKSYETRERRLAYFDEVLRLVKEIPGVESAGIYQGSSPRRVLVEVVTNSEGAVFQAIAGAAQSLLDLEAKQPRAVDSLELFLATDHRQRAGQFLVTRERARELVSKQLDLTAFYLKYVEF